MRRIQPIVRTWLGATAAVVAALSGVVAFEAAPAAGAPGPTDGAVATSLDPAFDAWTAAADDLTVPLDINPTTTGSAQALRQYGQNGTDFAATDIPFQWLAPADRTVADARGYQYVPVAGSAVGLMYNVDDKQGNRVTDLVLSRATLARILVGEVRRWSDPHIIAENGGRVLPDQPITVVYPTGESGTTALLYDFVAHASPGDFNDWVAAQGFPAGRPILRLDDHPDFAPEALPLAPSAVPAHIDGDDGLWSIGWDSFANALAAEVPVAKVINGAGNAVAPSAASINQALLSAGVNADLTPDLDGVYASTRPSAYPVSHFTYVVTPCVAATGAPTCKGGYPASDTGVAEAMAAFLRYVACAGQGIIDELGYGPLTLPQSQEIAKAIGRMTGTAAETLTAANCSNPTVVTPEEPEVPEEPEEPTQPPADRFHLRADGRDRIETAVIMSAFSYLKDQKAGAVVLARSDDAADALAGTPLAVAVDAPLLITPTASLDGRVAREILRVLAPGGTVYLLGGTNALSPVVEATIRGVGYNVVRLAGGDRYATSVAIADRVGAPTGIILATGNNAADALSAGAAAGFSGGSVVLTDDNRMPPVVGDYLNRHPNVPIVAVGGPAAAARPGTQSIIGGDRYQTSALVATFFFPDAEVATFANGVTGVDALAGGTFSAKVGAPVLLVQQNALPPSVRTWVLSRIDHLFLVLIYGGDVAVNPGVEDAILDTLGM